MKTIFAALIAAVIFAGCGDSAAPVANQSGETTTAPVSRNDLETVTAHSADRGNKAPAGSTSQSDGSPGGQSGWSRGGEAIDTTQFDSAIAAADKGLKAAPDSQAAKQALSAAYFKRAEALTEARQYAAALGDYRKALKLDPSNSAAKQWIDQIIVIYEGLNKAYPKEGEEPEPLPFKGSA